MSDTPLMFDGGLTPSAESNLLTSDIRCRFLPSEDPSRLTSETGLEIGRENGLGLSGVAGDTGLMLCLVSKALGRTLPRVVIGLIPLLDVLARWSASLCASSLGLELDVASGCGLRLANGGSTPLSCET